MGRSDITELEPKVRAALTRVAETGQVEDRWADLVANLHGGAPGSISSVADGDTVVSLDGHRRGRIVLAVAAALVVLLGGLVALDRLRVGEADRPSSPSTIDPRFPPEPAHLLPAGDPSTMRVDVPLLQSSVSRMYMADTGERLIWAAQAGSGTQFADSSGISPVTVDVGGVEVHTVTRAATATDFAAYESAGWQRDGISYSVVLYPRFTGDGNDAGTTIRLADQLERLVTATVDRPPAPPTGFFGAPLLENVMTGFQIRPVDGIGELVLWSGPDSVSQDDLDVLGRTLQQHPALGGGIPTPVTVNGRPALFMAPDPANADPQVSHDPTLVFSPVEGTMAIVGSSDTTTRDPSALIKIAEGLHEVDDATWSFARYGGKLLVSGITGSVGWTVAAPGTPLCVTITTLEATDRACSTLDTDRPTAFMLVNRTVLVLAPDGARTIEARGGDPKRALLAVGRPTTFTLSGTTWHAWAFSLPSEERLAVVTAFGADGQAFGTTTSAYVSTP